MTIQFVVYKMQRTLMNGEQVDLVLLFPALLKVFSNTGRQFMEPN